MNDPEKRSALSRRTLVLAVFGGLSVALGGLVSSWNRGGSPPRTAPKQTDPRLVSLSPGMTESLLHLELPGVIVGISDYCDWPDSEGPEPVRVGSALTPSYEEIARLRPTQILTSEVAGQKLAPLSRLAPTHSLPWLTVPELAQSLRKLGELVGREEAGRVLGRAIEDGLPDRPPEGAPRVLFAFDSGESQTAQTWFIRRNSIHGAVLRAAGGRNAVARDISGQPKLSPEELLALDPDAVVVLRGAEPDPEAERRALTRFTKLEPLTATRRGRLRVLSIPGALSVGPSVLDLISPLKKELDEMFAQGDQEGLSP